MRRIQARAAALIFVKQHGPLNVKSSMKLWLTLLLLSVAAGCGMRNHQHSRTHQTSVAATPGTQWPDEHKMLFEYHSRDGHAALESERVVLVFHGLTPEQQQLFHFQGSQQAVQIAGNGSSSITVTCATERGTVAFRSDYADGTNTLHLGQQTVRFTQSGRLLLAGDQTIDLNEGRKIVHLKNGHAIEFP